MPLSQGTQLGAYEIQELLGVGGMGEVYRARDTKLGRDVAVKVLPAEVAQDAERLKRFEREAQILASLNHPNIAAIYGFEEAGGTHFLVLEMVSGETLAEALSRRRTPLREALEICRQVAEALEATHEKGVLHRDLKPANIKVTPEGKVKVLDFGIAKATAPPESGAEAPTVSAGITREGAVLGTAGYMSPEQMLGSGVVDRRTDIWAFGCVLYELLTGRRAFRGDSLSSTAAAVVSKEADWSLLPAETPAPVRRLLPRCLAKDPRQRLHDMADARLEIEEALQGGGNAPATVREAGPRRGRRFAAALVLAAVALAAWLVGRRPAESPQISWSGEMLGGSAGAFGPRISPDGQTLAFQAMVEGQNQVAVLKPASGYWSVLTNERTAGFIFDLCWSPDGSVLYYDRSLDTPRGIFSVPVLGGEPRLVLENAAGPVALPDGSLLLVRIDAERRARLHRFWPEDARLEPLPAAVSRAVFNVPVRVFPDGKEAVFFGKPLNAPAEESEHLYALDLGSRRTRRLAAGFSLPSGGYDYFALSVSPDGRSVLFSLPEGNVNRVVEVPREGSGAARTLLTLTQPVWYLDAGRDGGIYMDQLAIRTEVLRFPASGGAAEQVAVLPATNVYTQSQVIPLPDGRFLAPSWLAGRERLLVGARGKSVRPFLETQEETTFPATMVGEQEVAFLIGNRADRRIAVASVPDDRIVRRLRVPASKIQSLAASPDGQTLYYVASGSIWTVPATDGEPRKLHDGDGVAVDPRNGDLIIKLAGGDRIRLVRLPANGGPEREIVLRGDSYPSSVMPLTPHAVGKDGRIAVQVNVKDSWHYRAAVLDPETGRLEQVPLQYEEGDIYMPGWSADGRIIALGTPFRASLWRFSRTLRPNDRSN